MNFLKKYIFMTMFTGCLFFVSSCKEPTSLLGFNDVRGNLIPLDESLTNHDGQKFRPRDLLQPGRPLILTFNFYHCANYCPTQLTELANQLSLSNFKVGQDVQVLTISFDPHDTVDIAKAKYEMYTKLLNGNKVPNGWIFAVGNEQVVQKILEEMRYRIVYDTKNQTYNHAQIAYIITPSGVVSQILSIEAIKSSSKILRLALIEASEGKKGDVLEQIFLYCTSYNQGKNAYSVSVRFILLVSGIVTLLVLGIFLTKAWRREFRLKKEMQGESL